MDARVGPVQKVMHMLVFQRVEMDVVEVALVILLVADQMRPIAALPNTTLAVLALRGGERLHARQQSDETELDHLPAQGKIRVAVRQRPQAMHVFGQHHPGIDM